MHHIGFTPAIAFPVITSIAITITWYSGMMILVGINTSRQTVGSAAAQLGILLKKNTSLVTTKVKKI